MTTDQELRIVELQDQLARIAGRLALDLTADFDDLLGTMNLAILEQAESDPAFLDQEPNYIMRFAAWRARDWTRRERHWGGLHVSLDAETDDGDGQALIERIVADDADPADLVDLADLADALADMADGLGDTTRRVLELMAIGYKGKEIARELSITAPSVCYHKDQIRRAAAAMVA